MKPRLFVGSSKESLRVATAIQQNLQYVSEVTVWHQGVMQLSATALESLLEVLRTCDFGVFVFSPDDVLNIRGEEKTAVRDNVLFELGMSMGVLGRERSFILLPDRHDDFRMPSDLFGLTPASYETGRSDGNIQAATGPACTSIQDTVERLQYRAHRVEPKSAAGSAAPKTESADEKGAAVAEGADSTIPQQPQRREWLTAWLQDDYERAVELVTADLGNATEDRERAQLRNWQAIITSDTDFATGMALFEEVVRDYPTEMIGYDWFARELMRRDQIDKALDVARRGLAVGTTSSLVRVCAQALDQLGQGKECEQLIRNAIAKSPDDAELHLALADHFAETGDAVAERVALEDADERVPDNEHILFRYARVLEKLPDKKLALVPYQQLVRLRPENPTYLGNRGNLYLLPDLHDLAMNDYQAVLKLENGQFSWTPANIGNLFKNRGFYREGIKWLQQALVIEPESMYAHERLGVAFRLRDEEQTKSMEFLKEAKRTIAVQRSERAKKGDNSNGPKAENPSV